MVPHNHYKTLGSNESWEIIPKPVGVPTTDKKWVFKMMKGNDGGGNEFKARLVACGFQRVEELIFSDMYALVSKYSTMRILVALANSIHQMDVYPTSICDKYSYY